MDVNEYFLRMSLWPTIVLIILLMVIGTVGNALVLYIYRNDYHKSVTSVFIYFLAVLDLSACLICMPSELTILTNIMSFPSWPWCKASRYLAFIFHGCTCVVLMFIAFNRYDRVCRSNNQWLDLTKAKRICFGILVYAIAVDVPTLFFYGEAKVPLEIQDDYVAFTTGNDLSHPEAENTTTWQSNSTIIIGSMCFMSSDYLDHILVPIFFFFQFLMYATLVVLVIFFYTRIIRKMIEHRATQERNCEVYTAQSNFNFQKQILNKNLSESVEFHILRQNSTNDLLKESTLKIESFNGSMEINNQTAVVYETTDSRVSKNCPKNQTCSQQKSTGRPQITIPVLDDKSVDNNYLSKSSNLAESNKLLSRRIESVKRRSQNLNQQSPSQQCIVPRTGLLVKDNIVYNGTQRLNEDRKEALSGVDYPKSVLETRSPNKTESIRDSGSEDDIEIIINKHETPEKASKSVSGKPESDPDKDNDQITKLERPNLGNKERGGKSSVTFSVVEKDDNTACQRPLDRFKRLDSINHMFGRPVALEAPPETRSNNLDNLLSPDTADTNSTTYSRRKSLNTINVRTNSMLLSISLAFILSFVPSWIILLWRAIIGTSFISSLNPTTFAIVSIFLRSSYVSNAVNPILYGLTNSQFRNSCKAIFRRK